MIVAEKLESFRKTWLTSVPFCERRHECWGVSNETWILALALKILTNEFINKSSGGSWVGAINFAFLTEIVKKFV